MDVELHDRETFRGTERFRLKGRLGAGGMGVVYLAHDEQRGLDVALKVLPEGLSAADVERLKREFRTLADVSHPNLVALHELVVDDAHCFFTMERIDGVELVDWMAQAADERTSSPSLSRWTPGSGPLRTPRSDETTAPSGRAAVAESAGASDGASSELLPQRADLDRLRSALRQLADALVTLHAADRLHLDLKPSNVLVRRDGRVVVLDFGIARTVSGDDDSMVTDDLSISGTPAYMAPEQAMGERVTAAADWYAVGTMLFAALTGRLPFTGAIASVLLAKQMKTAPRPSTFVSGIPEDLDDLVHRLLARAPETRPTGLDVLAWCGRGETSPGGVPSMAPPSARAPFVGRTELLAALEAALVAPRAGHPVVVWVGGRSGMGKTALVQQFLARARRRSSAPVVLTGRCYERESVPFKAFDGIADALARHLSRLARADVAALLPPDAHELAKVFPVMTRVEALRDLPRRRRDIPDPHELRTRGFRALKQTLATLAQRAPLVAVVDDLQWSDADSVLLLAELLCAPGAPQMLLVGTYRSDERATNALLADLLDVPARSGVDLRAIDVGPLEPDEAADLARRLVEQTASLHDADVASLVRESNGSPLFVAELVRHATTGAGDAPAAASLDELLLGRVRGLDAPSRALLELVALAGGPVEQGVVLRAAAEREPDDLAGALAVLKGASLVRTRGGRPTDAVECFHDRVRETVAARVDPERRALLFGRLGDALERSGRADPEQLAETYRRAGALDRAARHVERAADAAAAALAFDRAARLYAEALETGAREPEATRSLQRRLGDALANAGRSRRAAEAYVQAAADLQTPDALELRRLAAEHYMVSGHLDEGSRLLDGLLAEVDLPRISSTTRAVASILWRRTRNVLRGSAWRERSEQEVAPAELRRIDVCLTAALGYSSIDPIRGAAYVATLLGLALDAGEPRRVATALAFDGMMSATGGPAGAARAEELLGSAAALCERIDSPFATAFTTMMRGVAAWCMGRFREGATLAERSETLLRETCTGVMSHVDRAHDFVLVNRVALGDLPGVRVRLDGWLREADDREDRFASSGLRLVGGAHVLVALASDEADRAAEDVARALSAWKPREFHQAQHQALLSIVLVDLYRGDPERAARRFVESWDDIERAMVLRLVPLRVLTLTWRSTAALGMAARSRHASVHARIAQKDVAALRSMDLAWARAQADLLDAQLAAIAQRSDDVIGRLRSAIDGFERSEMALHAAVAERALGTRIGGDEGRAMCAAAEATLSAAGVVRPDTFCSVFAPALRDQAPSPRTGRGSG